jgi:hypothetical protein
MKQMNEQRFSAHLFLLVPQIIEIIMKEQQINEEKATELLYTSELYAQLEDEKTKLWHLASLALFELFQEEYQTGNISYPEEA